MSRELTKSIGLTMPSMNISESEDNYMISLAAPGIKRDDFEIDLEGNLLTISAETEKEGEEEKHNPWEYEYSSFRRNFILPEEVDREKIIATYENKVLTLTLPKKEQIKKALAIKKIALK